jgi:membrane dipeptidase
MSVGAETFATYDFGLSADEEERAGRLHEQSIVVDMLFQGPCGYRHFDEAALVRIQEDWAGERVLRGTGRTLLPRLALAGELPAYEECWLASGLSCVALDPVFSSPAEALHGFGLIQALVDGFPWLEKAVRAEEVRWANAQGKRAVYLNTQLVEGFGRDLGLLQAAHDLGLRMIMLAYNQANAIASGCTDRADGGITSFGARFVARMNELGMIVDTAHCGRRTTLDACLLSAAPVVASHTCAKSLYEHERGKTDEELEAIAATGGVVGVLALPHFLTAERPATIETMLDHVDHIVGRIGWEHVGIGSDWPLQAPKWALEHVVVPWSLRNGFRPEHGLDRITETLVGFDDYRDFPNVSRGLVARGYTDDQIGGILGENFLRVFEQVCG